MTVVVQPVPEAVESGTIAAGQVVVVGSHAGGAVVVDGVVVVDVGLTAEGHALDEALTQPTCGAAFKDVVTWLS